jgi:hypothetical protein
MEVVAGMFLPLATSQTGVATQQNYSGTANQVRVAQFVLLSYMTVGHIVGGVTQASGGNFNVGVYDSSGNNKLVDSGSLSCGTLGAVNHTLGSSVTLQPGVYYFAWAATDTSCQGPEANPSTVEAMANANGSRWGTADNTLSGGNLPSTLGTITKASVAFVQAYIEP